MTLRYSRRFWYTDKKLKMLHTKSFVNDPRDLPMTGIPFPGFWQSYLHKQREWRITIVGRETFDAEIYTDKPAKDDWRVHQNSAAVEFKRGTFPADQKEKCFEYLDAMGLRVGMFDFVESPDGTITFLECNPNGQYGWLEDSLGFPIADTIANELSIIAEADNGF